MKLWPLIGCLISIIGWAMTAAAASFSEPPLSMRVEAGFQGYYKIGRWLPLRVRIENEGPDLQADLIAEVGERRFRWSITLPSPAKKQVVFDVFADRWLDTLNVTLIAADAVIASVKSPVTQMPEHDALIVSLRNDFGLHRDLFGEQIEGDHTIVVDVDAASLPERWKGYDTVTGVILDPASSQLLIPAQREALTHWLLLGGQLLLLRPSALQGSTSGFVNHLLSLSTPSDFRIFDGSSDRRAIGLGRLVLSSRSSNAEVRPDSAAVRDGWINLLRAPAQPDARHLEKRDRQILRGAYSGAFEVKHLMLSLVALFLIYLGVVLLLTRFVVSHRFHPWRRFATLAVVVAAFACLSFVLGYAVQWGAVQVREAAFVHVFPGSTEVYVTSTASLLSPGKQTYPFRTVSAAYVEIEQGGEAPSLLMAPRRGLNETRFHVTMPLWSQRHLFVERFTTTPGFALSPIGSVDELVNQSPYDLSHCHLLRNDRWYRLPDIPAGRMFRLQRTHPGLLHETFDIGAQPKLLKRVLTAYQSSEAARGANGLVACAVDGPLAALTSVGYRMRHQGDTVLMFHL